MTQNLKEGSRSNMCSTKSKIEGSHPLLFLFPVIKTIIINIHSVLISASHCAQHFKVTLIAALWE